MFEQERAQSWARGMIVQVKAILSRRHPQLDTLEPELRRALFEAECLMAVAAVLPSGPPHPGAGSAAPLHRGGAHRAGQGRVRSHPLTPTGGLQPPKGSNDESQPFPAAVRGWGPSGPKRAGRWVRPRRNRRGPACCHRGGYPARGLLRGHLDFGERVEQLRALAAGALFPRPPLPGGTVIAVWSVHQREKGGRPLKEWEKSAPVSTMMCELAPGSFLFEEGSEDRPLVWVLRGLWPEEDLEEARAVYISMDDWPSFIARWAASPPSASFAEQEQQALSLLQEFSQNVARHQLLWREAQASLDAQGERRMASLKGLEQAIAQWEGAAKMAALFGVREAR